MLFGSHHQQLHKNYVRAIKALHDPDNDIKKSIKRYHQVRKDYYYALRSLRLFLDFHNCKMPKPIKNYDSNDESTWNYL